MPFCEDKIFSSYKRVGLHTAFKLQTDTECLLTMIHVHLQFIPKKRQNQKHCPVPAVNPSSPSHRHAKCAIWCCSRQNSLNFPFHAIVALQQKVCGLVHLSKVLQTEFFSFSWFFVIHALACDFSISSSAVQAGSDLSILSFASGTGICCHHQVNTWEQRRRQHLSKVFPTISCLLCASLPSLRPARCVCESFILYVGI